MAEGRRGVLAVCRAVLGDALDFSRFAGGQGAAAASLLALHAAWLPCWRVLS